MEYPDDPAVLAALQAKLEAEAEAARTTAALNREQLKFDRVSRKVHAIEYRKNRRL